MADMDKAVATQLANIERKIGKSLAQLTAALKRSGKDKHGELRDCAKAEFGLGHGDANTLVHVALKSDGASAARPRAAQAPMTCSTRSTPARRRICARSTRRSWRPSPRWARSRSRRRRR